MMTIAENAIPYPTTCSDDDDNNYEHKVFLNSINMDIPNLHETEDGCFVTIHRNHLNQYIKISCFIVKRKANKVQNIKYTYVWYNEPCRKNSAGDGIGWVLIYTLTTTDPLELSGTSYIPDDLPQPVVEAVLPDQQANEAVLPDENAIAALPQAA